VSCGKISWESTLQWHLLHKAFLGAPYTATDAFAMILFRDNTRKINGNNAIISKNQVHLVIIAIKNSRKYDYDHITFGS